MDACVGMKHVIANANERHGTYVGTKCIDDGTCIVATDNRSRDSVVLVEILVY